MATPAVSHVEVNGHPCRVWTKGTGQRIGFLAGFGGLPKWIPFLDLLADNFEVAVPSIPGFPGATGHTSCDSHLDWVMAVRELLREAGLMAGAPLIGSGPGGALAAEMAAFWPGEIERLVLISPWGLFTEADPMTDPWARRPHEVGPLLCEAPDRWDDLKAEPEGANSVEWPIEQARGYRTLFRSLEAMSFPKDRVETVLAANGSTDGSLDFVRERFPWVEIHEHGENLGFSAGNNRSAERARGRYVAFLNNDTRVDPGWLEPLVAVLDEQDDVICAGSRRSPGATTRRWTARAIRAASGARTCHCLLA